MSFCFLRAGGKVATAGGKVATAGGKVATAGGKVATEGGKVLSLIGHSFPHIKKRLSDLGKSKESGCKRISTRSPGSEFLYYIFGFNGTKA